MSKSIEKAVMDLVNLLPTKERYPNYKKSSDELKDIMIRSNVGKIVRAILNPYNTTIDEVDQLERENARNKKHLAEGEHFNRQEKANMRKTAKEIQKAREYIAEWTNAVAEFEALAEQFDITVAVKNSKTSAEVGDDLDNQSLLKELEDIKFA